MPTSTLAQLDLIEATADRGEAQRRAGAPEGVESSGYIEQMLADLHQDIRLLKEEERALGFQPKDQMLYDLLTELRRDINDLKSEQELSTAQQTDRHLERLLTQLREDITSLNSLGGTGNLRTGVVARDLGAPPSAGYVLTLAIPLGILGGIAAAFVLFLAMGLIRVETGGGGGSAVAPRPGPERSAVISSAPVSAPQQQPPQTSTMATPDQLIQTANVLLGRGEIAFARRVLSNAMMQGNITATLLLARTYDPNQLAQMYNPTAAAPDIERAQTLYEVAVRAGNKEAVVLLEELRNAK